MTEPRRPHRPPDDDLPDELRALIHNARAPTPLDRETRARLRRRLALATSPRAPLARPRAWRRHAFKLGLAALATFLLLAWLSRRGADAPVALPLPDPAMAPQPAHSLAPSPSPHGRGDSAAPGDPEPPGDPAREPWYAVQNRCSDSVCRREPGCCSGPWDGHCDDLLLELARQSDKLSGGVGRCYYHDRETCPGCACAYYLKVGDAKAEAIGHDGGTGCLRDREALLATLKRQCAAAVCE